MSTKIRNAFMNAAYTLIIEKGYDAVTVTEIAHTADYGRSTFYLYFKDKETLVWAMLEQYMATMDSQIQESAAHLPPDLRLLRAWQMMCADLVVQRPFFLSLYGDLSRRLRQIQKDYLIAVFEAQLKQQIFDLQTKTPPEIGARFIVGSVLEVLEYWLYHPEAGTADEIAAHLFRLVFRREPPPL